MENISSTKYIVSAAVIGGVALWTIYRYFNRALQKGFQFRQRLDKEIHIVTTASQWDNIYPLLAEKCQNIKAVGFDCEWVFWGHRLPVALIQLATHDGLCVLVRIYQMGNDIPDTLKKLLLDKSILKIGVAAKDDGKKLMKDYGMPVSGCVDLRHIIARVRGYNCGNQSLQGLAKGVLGVSMVKDRSIRCGDWEAETLSQDQINYAADDALIGIDIFMQLISVKLCGIEKRQQFYGCAITTDDVAFWKTARSLSQGIVDATFKSTKAFNFEKTLDDASLLESQGINYNDASALKPGRLKNGQKSAFMTRQQPLYDNCSLVSPDGTSLTRCNMKKAEWYINKGLGRKIGDDPLTVQLTFEPKDVAIDGDYYLQDKENICVVCGADENYLRRLVVPKEYRKYFPTMLKDHSSHDVLLLCLSCHLRSSTYDIMLRQRLAQECDAPLDSGKDSNRYLDPDLMKVVSAAKALLKSRDKLPEARINELEKIVKNFYGVQNLSDDILNQAVNIVYKVHNEQFVPHGKKVVDFYMTKEGGLLEFEKLWRKQFVDTMQPKFLPHLWSIEHRPDKLKL